MTSVYLVRHGQTAWNKEEVFRGRRDIPLDETGRREAEQAGHYFKPLHIDAVYSSPLSRARQTAQRIAAFHGIEVQFLEGLIDMNFGDWEGRSLQEVKEKDGERYRLWREEPHRLRLPGGETLEEVQARAMTLLAWVVEKHEGKTVILVTHRVVNKLILCGILNLDPSHFWQIDQDTTAINRIRYRKGGYVLSLLNETCHLRALSEHEQNP